MTIKEIAANVVASACHWHRTYSITATCHLQAAIETYNWAMASGKDAWEKNEIDAIEEMFYRHFEWDEALPAHLHERIYG